MNAVKTIAEYICSLNGFTNVLICVCCNTILLKFISCHLKMSCNYEKSLANNAKNIAQY